jgi:hypothetical protein
MLNDPDPGKPQKPNKEKKIWNFSFLNFMSWLFSLVWLDG